MTLAHHATTRRDVLTYLVAGGVTVALLPAGASATTEMVAAEIKKIIGDKTPVEGKIKLDLPSIAENGLVVPLNFEIESPMTEKDHVRSVHFFAEGNPAPGVAAFYFSSMAPKAAAAIRIRLAQTQHIVAIAEMSNGAIYTARKEVKVTIGGCGG